MIKDVRGRGLMIAVELDEDAGGARRYCKALLKKVFLCKETHRNVVRFAPPLAIKRHEIEWAVKHIEAVFRQPLQ